MASPVALPNVRTADVVADPTFFVTLPTFFVTLPTFFVTFPTFLVTDFVVLLAIFFEDPANPDAICIMELVPTLKKRKKSWIGFFLFISVLVFWHVLDQIDVTIKILRAKGRLMNIVLFWLLSLQTYVNVLFILLFNNANDTIVPCGCCRKSNYDYFTRFVNVNKRKFILSQQAKDLLFSGGFCRYLS